MGEYSLYVHTCPNGKKYIGITSMPVERRWRKGQAYENNSHFTNAIKKYGWENIKHKVLFSNLTEEKAKQLEKQYILMFKTNDRRYGYNITDGGEGVKGFRFSEESKRKMSEKRKGHKFSEEHNANISRALKGIPKSEEHKLKQRMTMTGRKASEETKKKFSEMRSGDKNPRYGKHCSEETKAKISAANKGKTISEYTKQRTTEVLGKPIYCVELSRVFPTRKAFADFIGTDPSNITATLSGRQKTIKGYHIMDYAAREQLLNGR